MKGPMAIALVLVAIMATVAAPSAAPRGLPAESGAAQQRPNPKTCDRNAGTVIMCVSRAGPSTVIANTIVSSGPRAGRVFTGGYVWISDRLDPASWKVSCDATLGGRLKVGKGSVYLAGGVHLRPIVHRSATTLTVGQTSYTTLLTCGWRIPPSAKGKLLSLVHPRRLVPCDVNCEAWGLHFEDGGEARECNQTSWRVRAEDATIGRQTVFTAC